MMDIAHLDELLEIVGDIRAEIVAARTELAGGQFRLADVEEEQSLYAVHVGTAGTIEFILDHIKQSTVQTLNKRQCLQVKRLQLRPRYGRGHCLDRCPFYANHCNRLT